MPGYHFVTTALVLVPTLYFAYRTIVEFSLDALMFMFFCLGVILAAFYVRTFPLGTQDRLIRLEERLRMERLLPDDLKGRIPDFTTEQLIGLRFASDEELPDLARKVLEERISGRDPIKRAVQSWRPDHHRI